MVRLDQREPRFGFVHTVLKQRIVSWALLNSLQITMTGFLTARISVLYIGHELHACLCVNSSLPISTAPTYSFQV